MYDLTDARKDASMAYIDVHLVKPHQVLLADTEVEDAWFSQISVYNHKQRVQHSGPQKTQMSARSTSNKHQ